MTAVAKVRLHKPHGKNRYCGPAAISAVTGLSTDEAAAVVRGVSGVRAVRGMHNSQMVAALRSLDVKVELAAIGGRRVAEKRDGGLRRQTLKEWMETRGQYERENLLIAVVTGHYVVIKGDIVVDSLYGREPRHILSDPSRNKVFRRAWVVIPPPKVKPPETLRQRSKRQSAAANARRVAGAKARALAKRLHLSVERDGDYYITSMAESGTALWRELMTHAGVDLADDAGFDAVSSAFYDEVLAGDSYGLDWTEALAVAERVAAYARRAHPLAASMMLDA